MLNEYERHCAAGRTICVGSGHQKRSSSWRSCGRMLRIMDRALTQDEAIEARKTIGWTFWAGPLIFAIACLIAGWFLIGADSTALAIFTPFVVITVVFWLVRLRTYNKIKSEIDNGVAEVIEGAPDKVDTDRRTGMSYLTMRGKKIRVPNDRYGELQDANWVRIAILPRSLVAVRVDVSRGVGLT